MRLCDRLRGAQGASHGNGFPCSINLGRASTEVLESYVNFVQKNWAKFIAGIDRLEAESAAYRAEMAGRFDWLVAGVIILSCICVATLEYFGGSSDYKYLEYPLSLFDSDADKTLKSIFRSGPRAELYRLMFWSASTCTFYFVIPALFIKIVLRERLRDFGLTLKGTLKHSWIYVALYLIVLPAVVTVAFTESFQKTYPFYDNAWRTVFDLVVWQIVYALQFFSLEFFYRGFMIQSLKPRFGFWAIFISVIPYCMIHFGKPYPETIGAIIAGVALGILAIFTRSIWLGVAIHVSVAITMDLLSLGIQGKLAKMSGWF